MFFSSLAIAAVAAVAGYNVYQSNSVMNRLSDLALANVEALADDSELPEIEVQCPPSSNVYGYCRKLEMNYNTYPIKAQCMITDNPNSSCSYSLELTANQCLPKP